MCDVGMVGLLYDFGKVMILVDILNKFGKLIEEEFVVVKMYLDEGY